MNRNLNASGPGGSDANPLPAPPSTAITRTHNQPQPHFPSNTLATAALQNHRGDPHLAGNEACLCSSCHLRDRFFPRSHDGRIVLPPLSTCAHPTRHPPRPIAGTLNEPTPLATPGLTTRRRNRTESIASNRDLRLSVAKFNEGRRGAEPRTPYLQSDKGEGSSTGFGRIPATSIGEVLPYRSHATDESLHTPQMSRWDELEGRPFSGPSRRALQSKKHDHKPTRPNPAPRILEPEEFSSQTSHLSQQSSSSQHKPPRSRLELFLNKHGSAHPQNVLPMPLAREFSSQTTKFESPRSTTPQIPVGAYGYEYHPISSPHQDILDVTVSRYPETPGRREKSHFRHHSAASRLESLDKPKIIKFSSRSENPQPDNYSAPTTSGERSVDSSPRREEALLPAPAPAPHLVQSQIIEEDGSSSNIHTQFRFQEPVVPEADTSSPTRRDLSKVQVKWDSERKRRQGYFSQEEGTEKSPFRHYNKANCDFEE